ncbi:hypothetical protein GCM10017750_60700 [Streptomyces racemochromogenes]
MNLSRSMRKLCTVLTSSLDLEAPVEPQTLFRALCDAMSRTRGGRPIVLRFERFPSGLTTSGLWLNMDDYDIVVVEKYTTPDHQLVILGHELWHMKAGHCTGHGGGAADDAARSLPDASDLTYASVAARSHYEDAQEIEAESFGLMLGDRCRPWLTGGDAAGAARRSDVAGRIGNALGYRGPIG